MGLSRTVMTAVLLSLLGTTVITDVSMGFPHCWGSAAIVQRLPCTDSLRRAVTLWRCGHRLDQQL
jgi:hypothetical protein